MTDEFHLRVTIRNNLLLKAMRAEGYYSVNELSRASGVATGLIYKMLSMKDAPIGRTGEFRPNVIKLANFLRRTPDQLFPQSVMYDPLLTNSVTLEVSEMQVMGLLGNQRSPEDGLMLEQAGDAVRLAVGSLTNPRHREVIAMRYGLGGNKEHTLDEIAKALGVTRERIRQMELAAIRQMKGPSRAAPLKAALQHIGETA